MTVSLQPKGMTFTRMVIAQAATLANGSRLKEDIAAYAAERWGEHAEVTRTLKTAVAAGTTLDTNFGGPLTSPSGPPGEL